MSESTAQRLPAAQATVRSRVTVPLRFPDGFTATAEVLAFRGLADGKEHLLLALGEWEETLMPGPGRRGPGPVAANA
jgi:GTP cyclohydrolase II